MLKNWIVFTDLDGTLLDHDNYSFEAALPAINALKALNIPIFLNSSKTISELTDISQQLDLNTSIIAENGSIIFDPQTQETTNLGVDYAKICALLDTLREEYSLEFAGFHDWDTDALQNLTGLDARSATKAKQRQASEPLLWQDSEDKFTLFSDTLKANHLKIIRGGRFWHVMGEADKVIAMQTLHTRYQKTTTTPITSIALGDSPNDNDMLCAADIGILVKNPNSKGFHPTPKNDQLTPHIISTKEIGPAGWNEAILGLLETSTLK
ncbi:MAG: Mannosyl-3-phosphoglycerate phosphatase family [uncultured Thiotrichaceae bacterium]|uniref:Mannosyl-3-phosphoglycerate phosphatase family n=1 Tax=uncultured Thiotrichaceae bacterium TaxID=298394 RepID=A0A6S6SWE6_9GAMM|nr:MAG: Mannosyl-3-phosphoglycerate phosphatase family [uncultured Thiotrichaceae bacterium]